MALTTETSHSGPRLHGEALKAVERALETLRFGSVQLVLHEGRVVQIEVTERQRFT
ncbi:YezD family protein [Sphingobium sp. CR28]|uniref:YezD family protein n=1 Tax=Sphingobium sp. CR28 TaxID=3400272 RepID=UPI003FED8F37